MKLLTLLLTLLGLVAGVTPLGGQVTIPQNACPNDKVDGPLYENGIAFYGRPARRTVEAFLAPPNDSYGRVHSGTQNVDPGSLRILVDRTDAAACQQLSRFLSNGTSDAHDGHWIYFTAGGFYFVAQWRPAMVLSNWSTRSTGIIVFDHSFTLLGYYSS